MECLSKILEDGEQLNPVICHNQADEYVQKGKVVLLPKSWSINKLVSYFDSDDFMRTQYASMCIDATDEDHMKFRTVYEQTGEQLRLVAVNCDDLTPEFNEWLETFENMYPEIEVMIGCV